MCPITYTIYIICHNIEHFWDFLSVLSEIPSWVSWRNEPTRCRMDQLNSRSKLELWKTNFGSRILNRWSPWELLGCWYWGCCIGNLQRQLLSHKLCISRHHPKPRHLLQEVAVKHPRKEERVVHKSNLV